MNREELFLNYEGPGIYEVALIDGSTYPLGFCASALDHRDACELMLKHIALKTKANRIYKEITEHIQLNEKKGEEKT